MTWNDFLRKITSRKLWLAVGGFVALLVVAFGGTENEAVQITSIIMAGAEIVGYVIGEGLVDASNKNSNSDNSDSSEG